ncbi:MAG: DNA polymerase I [Candidatus Omnitrophica bacterium]|nr:DNA polymerase I [Candidatus Omnitrophota bacterium]
MSEKRLYLIDAAGFCYRAFYAIKGFTTSFGQPTNAVYGFVNILNKILKSHKPDYLAACFDVSRDTFRQKKFAEYKIQRPPMPDGLKSQMPLIKEIIKAYEIKIFEKEGFEADDLIATIARKAKENNLSVVIVSSDKDMLQLVDDKVTVFSPYKEEGIYYDNQKVTERFGVAPERITDIISLMGDDSDNIPGVPGIGEKTAQNLINEFGSLENLLKNSDEIKPPKVKQTVKENILQINLNSELAILRKDVDIDINFEDLRTVPANYNELFRLFKYLEFKSLLKSLPHEESPKEDVKKIFLDEEEFFKKVSQSRAVFLFGTAPNDFIFSVEGEFARLDCRGEEIRKILADPEIKKIGHDLKSAEIILSKENIILNGLYFDTMIAAYLINPVKSSSNLADLSWDYLGEVLKNSDLTNEKALDSILKIYPKLEIELKDKSLDKLFRELEMPLVKVLARMEMRGIKLDEKLIAGLSCDIEKKLIKLIEGIYSASGTQFNINSPKQLGQVLFEKLKLPVIKKSKTGPSTDEEVLRALADKHELPALLIEYRQLMKLKNTYIDTLPLLVDKNTGRIHTSFNQTGTETGRLSSSNPNLQNIPVKTEIGRKIRKAIISSGEDYFLISCDYSQIELRVLAHLSGDQDLIKAFNNDLDIHRATAGLIYGVEEKDVNSQMRETAKRVNFGIVYGLTSYGLSRDLGIPVIEAQNFIDAYFLRYPKVRDYIQEQINKAKKDGFVTTILGRRRYIPEINNKNQGIRQFAERQAVNAPIQGSASDLIKLAMIEIDKDITQHKLKSTMIMQIHDELVFDVSSSEMDQLIGLVRERMENVLKLNVPIKVDVKKGRNWLEMEDVT